MKIFRIGLIFLVSFLANFSFIEACAQSDAELRAIIKAEEDLAAKRPIWEVACENGDAAACLTLAHWIRTTSPVDADRDLLPGLYMQACAADIAAGCDGLGRIYNVGIGVEQSFVKAREAYKKGCDLENVRACAAYGNLVFRGEGGERDTYEGALYLKKACDAEYTWACETGCILGARGIDSCF